MNKCLTLIVQTVSAQLDFVDILNCAHTAGTIQTIIYFNVGK